VKLFCAKLVVLWPLVITAAAFEQSSQDLDFFENKVRPLLVASCGDCHGNAEQSGNLRLDLHESIFKGGDRGPAIVPFKPDESLLIQAVRRTGELEMPPDEKLTEEQIAILERWVEIGAPWPAKLSAPIEQLSGVQETHWAFQPVAQANAPSVEKTTWVKNPVDAFILAKLEAHGLAPSPPADRRTLIRRVTYDLTGLPPSPAEVSAFVDDPAPDAYTKLIDRLLASQRYGEQWARHWLDVARYSDTKGYVYAREERFFIHAHTYRDWVVRAFNDDMPYDRFLLLQLAADQVSPDDTTALAAMGFLTLGRRFLGVTHDIIDDRIDVIGRGLLGLTVGCARCHDHKYDPISTDDYYSLYGVFLNCAERTVRIAEPTKRDEAYVAFQAELEKRQQALDTAMKAARQEAAAVVRRKTTEYLTAQLELEKYPDLAFNIILGKEDINPEYVRRWQTYLHQAAKINDAIFLPWRSFAALSKDDFSGRAQAVVNEIRQQSAERLNPLVAKVFDTPPDSMHDVAHRYGELFADIEQQWQKLLIKEASAKTLPDQHSEALRQVLYGRRSPCTVPDESIVNIEWFVDTSTVENLWKLQGEVDRWIIQSPHGPDYAVALFDRDQIEEPRVFRRGNPSAKGDEVPRRFLEVLSHDERQPFARGSGRLDLAHAIASPGNPLTARVWVNRVWMHHFGTGLVRTPSDFGLRSEPPTHPQLLDWLASQLVANHWGTKSLHRLILTSAAYQQQSTGPADGATLALSIRTDPENRLLWRMNPHRLSFEEWRDTLLSVSGELDLTPEGRAADLFAADNRRRTIYGLVDRQFLTTALRMFDFANPDLHAPQRSETIVSQQALFALNHPFVANRARALAARLNDLAETDFVARVARLYQLTYQRDASDTQRQAALTFLDAPAPSVEAIATDNNAAVWDPIRRFAVTPPDQLDRWEQLAHVLLVSNELMFVD
jgi:hypothetical protein